MISLLPILNPNRQCRWLSKLCADQSLQVTKMDSTDRVTVLWVDGSESQFNVHSTGLQTNVVLYLYIDLERYTSFH